MKYLKSVLVLGLLLVGTASVSFAQNAQQPEELIIMRTEIQKLRAEKAELRAKVEKEEITKEEAKAIWMEKMKTIRAKKEELFTKRLNKIQTRFEEKAAEHPERAESFKSRMSQITNLVKERREKREERNAEIREKVENGEITKKEAMSVRKQEAASAKTLFKGKREELKAEHKEMKADMRAKKEDMKARRDGAKMEHDEDENDDKEEMEDEKESE